MTERPSLTPHFDALRAAEHSAGRSMNVRRRLRLGGTALLALASIYASDVQIGKTIEANAAIEIDVIDASPRDDQYDNQAIVAINGFRSVDAEEVATHLGPIVQEHLYDGEIWSVDFGNAPLNERSIARAITAKADERNIDSIAFIGYSAGGIVSCETTRYLMDEGSLDTELDVKVSTPSGADALRNADQLDILTFLNNFEDAKYSLGVRVGTEMMFQRSRIKDPVTFGKVAIDVVKRIHNNDAPGVWLQADQGLAVASANFDECGEAIAQHRDEAQLPVTLYLGTEAPGYDYMVNDDKSARDIGLSFSQAGMQFLRKDVPGAVHTRPDINTDEYEKTISAVSEQVQRAIEREKIRSYDHGPLIRGYFYKQ